MKYELELKALMLDGAKVYDDKGFEEHYRGDAVSAFTRQAKAGSTVAMRSG